MYCESEVLATQVVDGLEAKLDRIAWRLEQRTDANGKSHIVWIEMNSDATVTVLDTEPGVSVFKRAGVWFLGLLPIESQL